MRGAVSMGVNGGRQDGTMKLDGGDGRGHPEHRKALGNKTTRPFGGRDLALTAVIAVGSVVSRRGIIFVRTAASVGAARMVGPVGCIGCGCGAADAEHARDEEELEEHEGHSPMKSAGHIHEDEGTERSNHSQTYILLID